MQRKQFADRVIRNATHKDIETAHPNGVQGSGSRKFPQASTCRVYKRTSNVRRRLNRDFDCLNVASFFVVVSRHL